MGDKRREPGNQETLTNEEIVTERKVPRRAFLSTSGVFLAGGAAALVAGTRAAAQNFSQDKPRPTDQPPPSDQQPPPDQQRPSDQQPPPDQQRPSDPGATVEGDPDSTDRKRRRKKESDPDKPKSNDP